MVTEGDDATDQDAGVILGIKLIGDTLSVRVFFSDRRSWVYSVGGITFSVDNGVVDDVDDDGDNVGDDSNVDEDENSDEIDESNCDVKESNCGDDVGSCCNGSGD